MKNQMKHVLVLAFASAVTTSCIVAPVSTNYESARSLKKNNLEATGNFTSYSASTDGESEVSNRNYGVRVGYGITDNFDIKLGYERCIPVWEIEDESISGVNFFSFSPKYTFIENTFAVKLPLNIYSFNDGDESEGYFAINPTIMGTLPINDNFEFGLSAGYQVFFEDDLSDFLSFGLGFGFSSDLDRWAIRPELGYQFAPEESDLGFFNFGLSLSYNFDLNQ
jgi:hypothetical protein